METVKDLIFVGSKITSHGDCSLEITRYLLLEEYMMRNAGLEEAQTRVKIAGRNINNLRYADDTFLMTKAKRN